MNIGEKIRTRRTDLGWSQRELAAKMGYNHSTVGRIETGKVDIPQSRILQFSEVLGVTVGYLMGEDDTSVNAGPIESAAKNQKADNRQIFSRNLRLFMAKANKSRKEVSEAIGVSYFTFSDWCNGKKYPRIEKLETLAKYFGISVSELVGEQQGEPAKTGTTQIGKDEVLDIILRLHTDEEFLKIVEKMSLLDSDKLKALKQFLNAFGK